MIIIRDLLLRNRNKAAYRGELLCPICKSKRNKFVEKVGLYRICYQCRDCHLHYQYDISNRPMAHPYEPFQNKPKFREILKHLKTRKT